MLVARGLGITFCFSTSPHTFPTNLNLQNTNGGILSLELGPFSNQRLAPPPPSTQPPPLQNISFPIRDFWGTFFLCCWSRRPNYFSTRTTSSFLDFVKSFLIGRTSKWLRSLLSTTFFFGDFRGFCIEFVTGVVPLPLFSSSVGRGYFQFGYIPPP